MTWGYGCHWLPPVDAGVIVPSGRSSWRSIRSATVPSLIHSTGVRRSSTLMASIADGRTE